MVKRTGRKNVLLLLLFPLAGLLISGGFVGSQEKKDEDDAQNIRERHLRSHVSFLTSRELRGRDTGTRGKKIASRYIASRFEARGLKGIRDVEGTDSYLQKIPLYHHVDRVTLKIMDGHQQSEGVRVIGGSHTGAYQFAGPTSQEPAPIVFAGYGIEDKQRFYNDFETVNVEGKHVLIMRGGPSHSGSGDSGEKDGKMEESDYRGSTRRAMDILSRDAKSVIVVNDPGTPPAENVPGKAKNARYSLDTGGEDSYFGNSLPIIGISVEAANQLLSDREETLLDLRERIRETGEPQSFEIDEKRLKLSISFPETRKVVERNVIGIQEGSDPEKRDQYIVIGAHYDSLGYEKGKRIHVYNGADDNASGTAAVLELARAFSTREDPPERSMVFILFAAEEKGLLGSRHYINNPVVPLEKTVTMICADMIGRGESGVMVDGTGTSKALDQLIKESSTDSSFQIDTNPDLAGTSDHYWFRNHSIPSLFYHTGSHDDYHRKTDDMERLSFPNMTRITRHMYALLNRLAARKKAPEWRKQEGEEE